MDEKEYTDKVCMDCKERIEFLCDFPGPRCLKCHAKKMEGQPLERPDFRKAIDRLNADRIVIQSVLKRINER